MVTWSTKRQLSIISVITAIVVFLIALPTFFVVYKAPSCTDGKKNQGEFGIDCGGPCSILCEAEALDAITHWQRAFPVKEGVYNAVAYVENPNLDSYSKNVPYSFKLYDSNNILIQERRGSTFLSPRKIFAIFEDGILTGTRIPVRTTFEFTDKITWEKEISSRPEIRITKRSLSKEDSAPRVDVSVFNPNLEPIKNLELVAIVYNQEGNAIASSRTVLDAIGRESEESATFTWPKPFEEASGRIEIIYRIISI